MHFVFCYNIAFFSYYKGVGSSILPEVTINYIVIVITNRQNILPIKF